MGSCHVGHLVWWVWKSTGRLDYRCVQDFYLISQNNLVAGGSQMNAARQTRGYRNCNPGNIDHNPNNKWLGLASPPLEPAMNGNTPRFCRFVSHEYGIRALALLLQTYQDRHNLRTVRGIINRWAPITENNTRSYQNAVANHLGVGLAEEIDLHNPETLRKLVEAIIQHELGGNPYSAATIRAGLELAGAVQPGVAQSRTTQAAAGTAAAGATAAFSMEILPAVLPHTAELTNLVQALGPWVVAISVAGAATWFIWNRVKQQRALTNPTE